MEIQLLGSRRRPLQVVDRAADSTKASTSASRYARRQAGLDLFLEQLADISRSRRRFGDDSVAGVDDWLGATIRVAGIAATDRGAGDPSAREPRLIMVELRRRDRSKTLSTRLRSKPARRYSCHEQQDEDDSGRYGSDCTNARSRAVSGERKLLTGNRAQGGIRRVSFRATSGFVQ
jgi:hypothetical protein